MVDIFVLALTHGLLALAAWRLVARADLDIEAAASEPQPAEEPATVGQEKRRRPGRHVRR